MYMYIGIVFGHKRLFFINFSMYIGSNIFVVTPVVNNVISTRMVIFTNEKNKF